MTDLRESLPDDFQGRDGLSEKFDSVAGLAKSYQELQGQLGSSARVPGEDASPEDWTDFYSKMGAPENHEGYEVPDGASDSTKSQLMYLREEAHKAGITTKQWDSLITKAVADTSSRMQEAQGRIESAKAEWVEDARRRFGDTFDSKLAMAERTYRDIVGDDPEVANLLEASGLSKHPKLLELFVKVGEHMADDTVPSDAGGAPQGNANSLAMRGRQLLKEGAVNNPRHPGYEQAYTEYMRIQQSLMEQGYAGITDPRLKETQEFPLYDDA